MNLILPNQQKQKKPIETEVTVTVGTTAAIVVFKMA
jgi:hypothetical protein